MNERELWFLNMLLAIAVGLMLLLGGCLGGGKGVAPDSAAASPAGQLNKVVSRVGWAAPFTALGVGGGVFLVFMGMQKIGLAVLAGSVAATVHALVTARYAWLLAIIGLISYAATMYLGFKKKQQEKESLASGFVLGFEGVKEFLKAKGAYLSDGQLREELNKVMGAALQPEAEEIVKKVKADAAHTNEA
jgi:hypothetical protein